MSTSVQRVDECAGKGIGSGGRIEGVRHGVLIASQTVHAPTDTKLCALQCAGKVGKCRNGTHGGHRSPTRPLDPPMKREVA
jgi:hypothetical protein